MTIHAGFPDLSTGQRRSLCELLADVQYGRQRLELHRQDWPLLSNKREIADALVANCKSLERSIAAQFTESRIDAAFGFDPKRDKPTSSRTLRRRLGEIVASAADQLDVAMFDTQGARTA